MQLVAFFFNALVTVNCLVAMCAGFYFLAAAIWNATSLWLGTIDTEAERSELRGYAFEIALSASVLVTALRALAATVLLAFAALLVVAPGGSAQAATRTIVDCDDRGCRNAVVEIPRLHPKTVKHRAMRENVTITKTVKIVRKAERRGGKRAVIIRGLFGEALAPMTDYAAPLRACGYDVRLVSHAQGTPRGADVVIGHSMGMFPALRSGAKRIFTIDGPFWAPHQNAPHEMTANFFTAAHPRVRGAINVHIAGQGPAGHIAAPRRAKPFILAMLGCTPGPRLASGRAGMGG